MLGLHLPARLALASGLLAACHDGGGGASVPLAELEARAEAAVCDLETRCGSYPDVGACEASLVSRTDALVASVNAGFIQYDGGAAAACLAAIRGTGCTRTDSLANTPAACAATFKGTLAGGASCVINEECASARCDTSACVPAGGSSCCAGICAPAQTVANPVPAGGDCSASSAVCAAGSECIYSSASSGPTCTPGLSSGQDCDPSGAASAPCLNHMDCLPSSSALGGTCKLPPAEGEACTPDGTGCNSSNDYCDPAAGKCARKLSVGMPCPGGSGCVAYARCDSGTCVALKKAGEACDEGQSWPICLGSLECTSGTCMLPAAPPVCR